MRPRWWCEEALEVSEESVYYDYIGLNHMNFTYNITIDGKPITDEQFSKVAKKCATVSQDLIHKTSSYSKSIYTILIFIHQKYYPA